MKAASTKPRKGGRPSQAQAGQIRETILAIATDLFLAQGYGDTSIEAIAKKAGISKRTFYSRFADKAELFGAVMHRLVMSLKPAQVAPLFRNGTLEEILQRLAKVILRASLSPQAMALHRLIVGESSRFPEVAMVVEKEGSRKEAIKYIAQLLSHHAQLGHIRVTSAEFAAEQFLQLVVASPQRRAMGLGELMTSTELDHWAEDSVDFFLNGCRAGR